MNKWRISTARCESVQPAKVRHGSRFHSQMWPLPWLSFSPHSTPPLGYWEPERVPTSLSYTCRLLIGQPNRPSHATGIITNKHSARKVFPDNSESWVYWWKCCAKGCHPSWTFYTVALCSLCAFFFFLGFISRLHCVVLLWDHDAYVDAVTIAVQL